MCFTYPPHPHLWVLFLPPEKCFFTQIRKLITQRRAIDRFSCRHCRFESSPAFDEWHPRYMIHCFYPLTSSFTHWRVSRPHLLVHRRGQREDGTSHLHRLPCHCRTMRQFSTLILPTILGLISMNLWMFNCGLYLHASLWWSGLISHDHYTLVVPFDLK